MKKIKEYIIPTMNELKDTDRYIAEWILEGLEVDEDTSAYLKVKKLLKDQSVVFKKIDAQIDEAMHFDAHTKDLMCNEINSACQHLQCLSATENNTCRSTEKFQKIFALLEAFGFIKADLYVINLHFTPGKEHYKKLLPTGGGTLHHQFILIGDNIAKEIRDKIEATRKEKDFYELIPLLSNQTFMFDLLHLKLIERSKIKAYFKHITAQYKKEGCYNYKTAWINLPISSIRLLIEKHQNKEHEVECKTVLAEDSRLFLLSTEDFLEKYREEYNSQVVIRESLKAEIKAALYLTDQIFMNKPKKLVYKIPTFAYKCNFS